MDRCRASRKPIPLWRLGEDGTGFTSLMSVPDAGAERLRDLHRRSAPPYTRCPASTTRGPGGQEHGAARPASFPGLHVRPRMGMDRQPHAQRVRRPRPRRGYRHARVRHCDAERPALPSVGTPPGEGDALGECPAGPESAPAPAWPTGVRATASACAIYRRGLAAVLQGDPAEVRGQSQPISREKRRERGRVGWQPFPVLRSPHSLRRPSPPAPSSIGNGGKVRRVLFQGHRACAVGRKGPPGPRQATGHE